MSSVPIVSQGSRPGSSIIVAKRVVILVPNRMLNLAALVFESFTMEGKVSAGILFSSRKVFVTIASLFVVSK